jgi:hypothetical protein
MQLQRQSRLVARMVKDIAGISDASIDILGKIVFRDEFSNLLTIFAVIERAQPLPCMKSSAP